MLSLVKLKGLSKEVLEKISAECNIPLSSKEIIKKFNVSIEFSKNSLNENIVTLNTRNADAIWWKENKNSNLQHWRESSLDVYSYSGFCDDSECSERLALMVAILAIKPQSFLNKLNDSTLN